MIERSHKDAETALWTLVSTSFGLTIAALVQIGQGQMNFLQGILVTQLTWFAMFGTYLALASYSRSKGENTLVKIAAVIQTYFSTVLTIAMWAKASKLPTWDCPETSQVKFVMLFGLPLPARTSGRIVAITFASLVLVLYAAVTFIEFKAWLRRWEKRKKRDTEQGNRGNRGRRRHRVRQKKKRSGFRQRWVPADVGAVFFGILMSQIFILAYFIATTELIIIKSGAQLSDTSTWGFGQVLALVVVIPSVLDLLQATKKKLWDPIEPSSDEETSLTGRRTRNSVRRPALPASSSGVSSTNRLAPPPQSGPSGSRGSSTGSLGRVSSGASSAQ
ncbi:hypothetical protein BU17DRAFT_95249 [Hysterangium stoloniferum]|nr:hypothetical protein BU17DRAFT_95249 [Hysterangium stoloniferum]